MTNQLIPVFAGEIAGTQAQLVDARLLHGFMEVMTRFNDWIRTRIEEYGFVQDEDFLVTENSVTKSGRGGDRRSKNYHLSIGMAKELAMVERNDKGREVRRYFIECERRALAGVATQNGLKSLESPTLTASDQQTLSEIVDFRARDYGALTGKVKSEIWSRVHRKFRVAKYQQLPREQLSDAITYVMNMEIRTKAPAQVVANIDAPLSMWKLSNRKGATGWLTYSELNQVDGPMRPISTVLRGLKTNGHDVSGAQAEYDAMRVLLDYYHWRLDTMATIFNRLDGYGLNISQS